MNRSLLFAAGPNGLQVSIPDDVELLPVSQEIDLAPPFLQSAQQEFIRAALESGTALKTLAKGHRKVAVLVGNLGFPAPYDIALPVLVKQLVDAEIRPSRISFLVCPGNGPEILGRAAIHRYGEEIAGEHDLRVWRAKEGELDPLYAAADLRIAVAPHVGGGPLMLLPDAKSVDFALELQLGKKVRIDIAGARVVSQKSASKNSTSSPADVFMASGGGADWEETLEEALLSLDGANNSIAAGTVVLVFGGGEGVGSAAFTRDLWSLFQQAEEMLARGESLADAVPESASFDPALSVAQALGKFKQIVLLSPGLAEHSDSDDLVEKLGAHPNLAQRMQFCAGPAELWPLLRQKHEARLKVLASPLGWRENAAK